MRANKKKGGGGRGREGRREGEGIPNTKRGGNTKHKTTNYKHKYKYKYKHGKERIKVAS